MPLAREVAYWEAISKPLICEQGIKADNVWKRRHQVERLLRHEWIGHKVLEIGVGNGIVAATLETVIHASWSYIGTELSENFRKSVGTMFGLKTVEADVRELPDGPFTRIIALDSLEHVRPEHRDQGYERMGEVAAPGCLLFLHYSHSESFHFKEFDHAFGLEDLVKLEGVGFKLKSFDRYVCDHPKGPLDYVFSVLQK